MKDLSILVSTYDGNSSLWRPLEKSFDLYWNSCNFPLYITSNFKEYESKTFNFLKVGDEISWSDNILKCLNQIDSKYVMFCFDDCFWKKEIDNDLFNSLVQECVDRNWEYLRLHPTPRSRNIIDEKFSRIEPGSKYRASLLFAIFRKDVLIKLLQKEETAWDFEKKGSVRSDKFDSFYQINFDLFPYYNLLIKSELEPFAMQRILKQGIDLSDLDLKIMKKIPAIKFFIYKKIYNFLSLIRYKIGLS